MNIALISAGGSGQRMGQDIPKQFLSIEDKPVIVYTLEAFQAHEEIDVIAVVCIKGWDQVLRAYARQFGISKLDLIVEGGDTGQESIRNGVLALNEKYSPDDVVLVHDAIRPMVSKEIISGCISETRKYGSAITVIPCAEAMLETKDGLTSVSSYPRDYLKRTQTPQGFILSDFAKLHQEALEKGITNSVAPCTLMVELEKPVHFCLGSEKNIKLTTPDDLDIFRALLHTDRMSWLK